MEVYRSDLQMEKMRKLFITACFTVAASTFWGAVVAAGVRYAFSFNPSVALLSVGLPVALAFAAFMFPRLRKTSV